MGSILPPPNSPQGEPRVTRRDFVRRSRVHLSCPKCGTTTITCDIDDADLYEQGFREHICDGQLIPVDRLAYRRLLAHLAGL